VIIWDVYRGVPLHVIDTQPQTQLPRGFARPDPIVLRKDPGNLTGVIGVQANQLAKDASIEDEGGGNSSDPDESLSGALVGRTPAMKQALAVLHGGHGAARRKQQQVSKSRSLDVSAEGTESTSSDVLAAIRGYDESAMLKEAAMDQRLNTLRAERALMASALTYFPAALVAADEAGQAEEALMEEYAHRAGPSTVAID